MSRNRYKKALALTLAAALMTGCLTACGSSSSSGASDAASSETAVSSAASDAASSEASSVSSAASTAASSASKTEYPLEVTFYGLDGEVTCTYEQAPEKTLVVGQGNLETMLALGLEDHIVAVTEQYDVSDRYADTAASLNYLNVNLPDRETILDLDPDFIFAPKWLWMRNSMGLDEWLDRGINLYINENWNGNMEVPRTLESEYNDIMTIGEIFDVQERAQEVVDGIRQTEEDILAKTADVTESPTALILYPYEEDEYVNYSNLDLAGNMLEEVGGTLAARDKTSVSKEEIVSADPEVIIVLYDAVMSEEENKETAETAVQAILDEQALANVQAVQDGNVRAVAYWSVNVPGAAAATGLLALAEALYPDVDFSDIEAEIG